MQEQEVRETAPERSDPVPADTMVQLVMPSPVDPDGLSRLYRRLESAKDVEVIGTFGSSHQDASVKLLLRQALPLLQILRALPEVATVQDMSGEQDGGGPGLMMFRLVLTSPPESAPKQVAVAQV